VLGQAQQDFHYLGLEANGLAFGRHAVEGRIDDPAPHFEALLRRVDAPAQFNKLRFRNLDTKRTHGRPINAWQVCD